MQIMEISDKNSPISINKKKSLLNIRKNSLKQLKNHIKTDITNLSYEDKEILNKLFDENKHLKNYDNQLLYQIIKIKNYDIGEIIIQEGEIFNNIGIILEGSVQVMKKNRGIIGYINKGSWFGNFKSLSLATLLILKETKLVIINYDKLEIKKNKPLFKQKNVYFKKEDIIFENLNFYNKLGEGAFSKVFICQINNKDTYAIKCMNKSNIIKSNAKQQISNEIELLKQINNHNNFIVKFINKLEDNINIYLLLEYIQGREFFEYLCSRKALNEIETKFYISNIIIAIEYLHSQNIIFRDLKPENIIISTNGYLKLIDFGFAKKINDNELTYTLCGTPDYLAPEILSCKGYNKSVDFWTIGILTYELLHAKTPYINNDVNVYNFYNTITNKRLKFNDDINSNFKNFISSLLFINPKMRLG
jgi:tRNA A-37 threonylcarbamoyl transferase component Bud32